MCTSLTLKSIDGKNFLARTMDFPFELNESLNLIPRNFDWYSITDKKKYISNYAVLGMSTIINNHPIFADGVNESGLSCATLYFPGFAYYQKNLNIKKYNIAPYDFVYFLLSSCTNLEEAKALTKKTEFIDTKLSFLGVTPPLHWIVSDKSGNSITIENTITGLKITENPIGIMTNSPEIEWHLTNLRQYVGIKPTQSNPVSWSGLNLASFSQGGGTFGIPGDYTPPSRFVRAAYLKSVSLQPNNEIDAVNTLFHILGSCEVPKGAVIVDDKDLDFTMYTSVICNETCTYYYKTYDNSQIVAVNMLKENLDNKEIKNYPKLNKQQIKYQN